MGPGIAKGVAVDRRVTHCDIAPTVASLLGFRADEAQGSPLAELLG